MKMKALGTLVIIAALSGFANAHADDAAKPAATQARANKTTSNKGHQDRVNAKVNELTTKLNLTDEQKKEVQEALTANEAEFKAAWASFANAEFQLVNLEAEMLAAIEDTMPEPKKQEFRQKRGQDQKVSPAQEGTEKSAKNVKPATTPERHQVAKPVVNGATSPAASQNNKPQGAQSAQASDSGTQQEPKFKETVLTMVIVPVQEQIETLSLSPDQQNKCDAACQAYHQELASAYQTAHQSHRKLVELQAARIRSVEKILTPQQLEKLRSDRQQPASKAKANDSKKS